MRCAALLLVFTSLMLGHARAAPIPLTPIWPPARYEAPGRNLDILGIAPGMSPDAVRDILTKAYGNAIVTQDQFGLSNKGVTVESQPYTSRIGAQRDGDQITVLFATPTTGNGVVEISRQLSFRDETAAPTLQQQRADLIAQYGKPGSDAAALSTGEVQIMTWSFHGDKPAPCPKSSCRAPSSEGLEPRNLAAYARSVKDGNDLTIVATLLAGIAAPTRAPGRGGGLSDAATKLRTLEAAISQLKAASTRKDAKPAG